MEVYIEYVILDNLIINSILIYLTSITLRFKVNKYRILPASVVGTIFAIFLPFIKLQNYLLILLKMLVGLFIVLIFSKFNFKSIMLNYLIFVTYTFLMGGLCFGILYLLNSNVSINGLIIYNFNIPISLIVLIIFIYFLILQKFIKYRKNIVNLTYPVELFKDDKLFKLNGFLDTGNQIYDDLGNPIIVISLNSFLNAYPNVSLIKVATNNVTELDVKTSKYLTITTANAVTKMLTFKCDKVKILEDKTYKIFKDVTIGVSNSNFNKKFDCILHQEYI